MGWGPGLNKKEKSSWAQTSISACFLTVDTVLASASCSIHHAFPSWRTANYEPKWALPSLSCFHCAFCHINTVITSCAHTCQSLYPKMPLWHMGRGQKLHSTDPLPASFLFKISIKSHCYSFSQQVKWDTTEPSSKLPLSQALWQWAVEAISS